MNRVREYDQYPKKSSQIAAATRMAYNLKEAVRYQVYISAYRKKRAFLDILTPRQALLYKKWLLSNRERCSQVLEERRKGRPNADASMALGGVSNADGGDGSNLTLEALCRTLEEILKISQVTPAEAPLPADDAQQQQQLPFQDFGY